MTAEPTDNDRETMAHRGAPAQSGHGSPRAKASDAMTSRVVSVHPDMPVKQVAKVLLQHGISAAPVIDENGVLLGIVSEGDLIARGDAEREARQDWWLALLAEDDRLAIADLESRDRAARDVMSTPVLTVQPDADLTEIARILTTYRVKRLPVVRDGHVLGIVSRADVLRTLAHDPPAQKHANSSRSLFEAALARLDERFLHHPQHSETTHPSRSEDDRPEASHDDLKVSEFQRAVIDFEEGEVRQRQEARRAISEQQERRVGELLDGHISDAAWQDLLRQAHEAAANGQKEYLLLRFPSQLCSDGGRAINVPDPNWPASLRGEAAEIYLRWHSHLRPGGFRLAARILDFPDGVPGDAGLFLIWGEET